MATCPLLFRVYAYANDEWLHSNLSLKRVVTKMMYRVCGDFRYTTQ